MSFRRKDNVMGPMRPTKLYISYVGRRDPEDEQPLDGRFKAYDKEAEKDIDISDRMASGFVVLDANLLSISGYLKEKESFVFSNEVRRVTDQLVAKLSKTKKLYAKGTYQEIKANKLVGGSGLPKYTRCIYIMLLDNGELAHLSLNGSANSSWIAQIEQGKGNFDNNAVVFKGSTKESNGTIKFYAPVFAFGEELSDADVEKAIEWNDKVQEFLEEYLEKDHTKIGEESTSTEENASTDQWAFIEDENGKELGQYSFAELKTYQAEMESAGDEDNPMYDFVCRGVYEHQQKQKAEAENAPKETPKKVNPFAAAAAAKNKEKSVDPKSIFQTKKKEEEPLDESWKEVEINGTKLGEMSAEDLNEAKSFLDEEENAEYKEQFASEYDSIVLGLSQLSKLPF